MGAAVGGALAAAGHVVGWAAAGRSPASRDRAERAGLRDHGQLGRLLGESETVLSICPPAAAGAVAAAVAAHDFAGTYVDANAIAPRTASAIAAEVEAAGANYVDGGIVGPPPGGGSGAISSADSSPTLFLSGAGAEAVAALFADTPVDAHPLAGEPTAASAAKVAYAAWTKGSAALLVTVAAAARRAGVEAALAPRFADLPGFESRLAEAEEDAATRGWRWSGEMEEVAAALAELGLPSGFHAAAAEVFRDA